MEDYYKKIKNFRTNINFMKTTNIEFQANDNKILFLPKNENYVNIFLNNYNNIEFNEEININYLDTVKNVKPLKEKETEIKNKIVLMCKKLITTFQKDLSIMKSTKINNKDYEWVINDLQLGTLWNFIEEIIKNFKEILLSEIEDLITKTFNNLKLEDFRKSYIVFSNYRNSNYHYNTEDQMLLLSSLQLIEKDLTKTKIIQTFTIQKEINKEFQLIYQNHDYFKESLEIFKQIQKTMI